MGVDSRAPKGWAMRVSSESDTAVSVSERDVLRKVFWFMVLCSSLAMLYYEYVWCRFVLHNLATISFVRWLWTSLVIAVPGNCCFICLSQLRRGIATGR